MKILMAGAQGQLARSLIERAEGYPRIELIQTGRPVLDLEERGSAQAIVSTVSPDVVLNAAAYTAVDQAEDEPRRAFRINADGAGELAAAAAAAGAMMVYISTDYVFDGSSTRPYREDDPVRPLNAYGASKAAGEEIVRAANPNHLILRTSWLVSPFGSNFVKSIMNAARTRDVLTVVDDQFGRPTSALHLADYILKLFTCCARENGPALGKTYHVADIGETNWYGLAIEIMEQCHRQGAKSAEVQPIKSSEWPTRAARPGYSVLDTARFAADFGIALNSWQSGVEEIVKRLVEADVYRSSS